MSAFHDLAAQSYGGDEAGLICGYLFDARAAEPARAIDSSQAAAWLAQQRESECSEEDPLYVWLHFNLSNAHAERWLLRHANLSDTFYETLHEGLPSTRIERDDDSLIAVINDVQIGRAHV